MLDINTVNPIGVGTFLFGGGYDLDLKRDYANYSRDVEAVSAMRYSIEQGQNHLDTGYGYSDGHCEELVGEAIKGYKREKLFIADKLSKGHMLHNAVVPCVKIILQRLQIDYLDLLYAHTPNVPEDMTEYLAGMNDALDQGLVRFIAVSNFDETQLKRAVSLSKHRIVANQVQFNLFDRVKAPQSLLDYCEQQQIKVVAYQPLRNNVFFSGIEHPVIAEIAKAHQKTEAQVALNWLVKVKQTLVIPKAMQKEHIDENLGSLDFTLSPAEIEKLNNLV
jgi:diketogulonate reductase-like aldo/keto reductase